MASKLSAQLMDAYMVGDEDEINKIKSEIESINTLSRPKKKDVIFAHNLLNDDTAPAITVYNFLNKSLGDDWWEWEMETIERLLFLKHHVALEDVNRDKIYAIRHVCSNDACFDDWYEFNQVALSFNSIIADFEYLRSPSPGMLISTVGALNHIRPDRESIFSTDVIDYIVIVLQNNGIYTPPPSLADVVMPRMRKVVSDDMQSKWVEIINRYKEIVTYPDVVINETDVDIQAKRLVNAEAAASTYEGW